MSTFTSNYRLNDVISYVKRAFGDESGVQITDQDIIAWANQAQVAIVSTTKCIQGKAATDLLEGVYAYDLPFEDAIDIVNIRVKGLTVPGLEHGQAEQQLTSIDPERTMSGPTQYWTKWGNSVEFYPTPGETITGGITIFYLATPTFLVNPADFLSLPDRYYTALLDYIMSEAYRLDEDYEAAQQSYQNYQLKIGETLEEESQAQNLFYPTLTIVDWD